MSVWRLCTPLRRPSVHFRALPSGFRALPASSLLKFNQEKKRSPQEDDVMLSLLTRVSNFVLGGVGSKRLRRDSDSGVEGDEYPKCPRSSDQQQDRPKGVMLEQLSTRIPVHVEAVVRSECALDVSNPTIYKQIENEILAHIKASTNIFTVNLNISVDNNERLWEVLESLTVSDIVTTSGAKTSISYWQAAVSLHIFRLSEQECEKDFLDSGGDDAGGDLPASEQWELPNKHLVNLWESVIVDDSIKQQLLGYCSSSMHFSDHKIDTTIISWNRLVLLHGPPGTGKTTLAKALAQKVFIKNCKRYTAGGVLVEINSHSLFSKWFSESGKLVMKLFDHIGDIADDEDCFVCVLIDEVESITSARSASARSNEPGDAVRVVNSVLTSLDALKRRKNVLVLCTSNMLDSIDAAFRDRIDLCIYMGPPPAKARYQILHSCVSELMTKGIIAPYTQLLAPNDYSFLKEGSSIVYSYTNGVVQSPEMMLYHLAVITDGQSGRSLRKLPIKAHAFYLQRPTVTIFDFIGAMIETCKNETENLQNHDMNNNPKV